MSSSHHAIVWIDHRQAKIFRFDSARVGSSTISSHPRLLIRHKDNARDSGHAPVPNLAKRIAAVQTLDHPSDGELAKLVGTFFGTDARMRAH